MWIFLATEVMLFGGMFLAYTIYRATYPTAFDAAATHQNLLAGSINTFVLIISSLMMALAVRSAQVGDRRAVVRFLGLTALLGTVFLGIKFVEYYQHWQEGLVPGLHFLYSGPDPGGAALFFFLYFVMTGLHAIHLTIGVGLVLIVMLRARAGHYIGPAHYTPVDILGLYWHFVDVVWLFLFAILYLIAPH
jgi:cytochrome c oxidase subunit 3